MVSLIAVIKGLVRGDASIDYIGKTPVSKSPGDVTYVGHN